MLLCKQAIEYEIYWFVYDDLISGTLWNSFISSNKFLVDSVLCRSIHLQVTLVLYLPIQYLYLLFILLVLLHWLGPPAECQTYLW